MARVDVRPLCVVRLHPWYGELKKRLLTLSSCSFEKARQISESVLLIQNRNLRKPVSVLINSGINDNSLPATMNTYVQSE